MENQNHYLFGTRRFWSAAAGAVLGLLAARISMSGLLSTSSGTPPGHALVEMGFAVVGAALMVWRAGLPKPVVTATALRTREQFGTLAARGLATTFAAGVGQFIGWQLGLHLNQSFAYEGSLLFVWLPTVLASATYVVVGRVMRSNGNASTFAGAGGVLLVPLAVLASLFGLFVFVVGMLLNY